MAHNLQGGLFFREILAQVNTPLLTKAVQELAESKISNFKYGFVLYKNKDNFKKGKINSSSCHLWGSQQLLRELVNYYLADFLR